MSNIVAIHDALAAMDMVIPSTEEVIPAWKLSKVHQKVTKDRLPIRIIMPPGGIGKPAVASYTLVTRGRAVITWRVAELMLYRMPKVSVSNVWPILAEYMGVYIETMAAQKSAFKTLCGGVITGFEPTAAVYEWPNGGSSYQGVQTVLTIEESICL